MLYPKSLSAFPGNSNVSSIVIILNLLRIVVRTEPSKDVLPELLVPATNNVLFPSIKKLINPAARAFNIPVLMNSGNVHGLSRCLLNAYANPDGFSGGAITPTRALAPGNSISVSRIGFASSSGLPEINLNLDAQLSASAGVGIIFVLQSPYSA